MKDNNWNIGWEYAQKYYKKNNNLLVKRNYKLDNYNLGRWIGRQRENYKTGKLSKDKIDKLNELEMVWDVSLYEWTIYYNYALDYYQKNNHLKINGRYVIDNYNLGEWIKTQRKRYIAKTISKEEIEKLELIGMKWNIFEDTWDIHYKVAKDYYKQHGHLKIPDEYVINEVKIGKWICNQKTAYKNNKLSKERIKRLEELDLQWEIRDKKYNDSWNEYYKIAKDYYKQHGHLKIPDEYVINEVKIGRWICNQRTNYKNKKISVDHIKLLESIGMIWEVNDYMWKLGLKYSTEYFMKNSNLLIDTFYKINNFKLGFWIGTQRAKYKNKKLTKYQIDELEKIGMIWDTNEYYWQYGFNIAKTYYKKVGNLKVLNDYIMNGFNLGTWLQTQRSNFKNGLLDKKRKELLDSIGIIWDFKEEQWETAYKYAENYYKKYYNLLVPISYKIEGFPLGAWVAYRRKNKEILSQEQIIKLEEIGMIWDVTRHSVLSSFPEQAVFYYISKKYPDAINRYRDLGFELDIFIPSVNIAIEYDGGRWHKDPLKDIKKNQKCLKNDIRLIRIRESQCPKLEDKKIEIIYLDDVNDIEKGIENLLQKLNINDVEVNIEEDKKYIYDNYIRALNKSWRVGYNYAEEYYKEYSNLLVPIHYINRQGYRLGVWISRCRREYRTNRLTAEMIMMLNDIEMIWEPYEERWENGYNYAVEYYENKGNLLVPADYIINNFTLGNWINVQRRAFKEKRVTLTAERIEKLNKIGMVWDVRVAMWEEYYNYAKDYYEENGHLIIPNNYVINDCKLGCWILRQRQYFEKKENELFTQERIDRLNNIGMVWDYKEYMWNLAYSYAKEYYIKNNNLKIPQRYTVNNFGLGQWLCRQKRAQKYKNNAQFTKEKERLLEKIGIEWF